MIKFFRDVEVVAIFYILTGVTVNAIGIGINAVVLPTVLISNGLSSFFIGLSATTEIASSIIASFFVSRIVSHFKKTNAALIFASLYALSVLTMFYYKNYGLWLFFVAVNGTCWFSLIVIRNSWMNHLLENKNRSVILALATTLFCTGYGIGSLIVKTLGAQNYLSAMLAAFFIFFSALILLFAKKTEPKTIDSVRIGFKAFFKHDPRATMGRFFIDFMAGCIIFLSVAFGVKIGLTPENAGLLISAFMLSGFCDLYAGFMVKKYDRYKMIRAGFISCLTMITLAWIFHENYILLWFSYFFFGASTALTFISSLTIINETFEKEKLTAANATLMSVGSTAYLISCFTCGILMEIFSFYGFFITIIFGGLSYLTFEYFYEKNKTRS